MNFLKVKKFFQEFKKFANIQKLPTEISFETLFSDGLHEFSHREN
jgi:hypothetical protein